MKYDDWKLPFNFALALHAAVIFGAVYLPQIFKDKPLFPDIYTVDLINIAAPLQETPQIQEAVKKETPKPEVTEQKAEPAPPKEAVSIAKEQPVVEQPPQVAKPVSIKPLKHKKVYKNVVQEAEAERRRLEKILQERLAEAREAEREAAEAAQLATDEAVNRLKDMLRTTSSTEAIKQSKNQVRTPVRQGKSTNILEKQYYASIYSALQPHWKLPGHKIWDPDLSATVVIHIAKNGDITRRYFEQKSGDRVFDQFVLKALSSGSPLPPIPDALRKSNLELGLKFTVNSIQ